MEPLMWAWVILIWLRFHLDRSNLVFAFWSLAYLAKMYFCIKSSIGTQGEVS